jgi:hypothetical protein
LCRKLRFWNTHERVVYISPLPSINNINRREGG